LIIYTLELNLLSYLVVLKENASGPGTTIQATQEVEIDESLSKPRQKHEILTEKQTKKPKRIRGMAQVVEHF
jgi:hypothetical protein